MNHEEWLSWRKQGIGSSDAPAIMNASPYKTALQLYEEKISTDLKEDTKSLYIKIKGQEVESKIRAQFEIMQGKDFKPLMCQDANFPFLRCTLDGITDDRSEFVEIKLLGAEDFETAKQGKVPDKYYWQICHQFIVTNCQIGWFAAYLWDQQNPNEYDSTRFVFFQVPRKDDDCVTLIHAEVKFWNDNVMAHRPPAPSSKDFKHLRGITKLVKRWKKLKSEADQIDEEMQELRKQILTVAEADGHPRLQIGDVRLQKISVQGNVDYEKLCNDKQISAEEKDKYRKGGRIQWNMNVMKTLN